MILRRVRTRPLIALALGMLVVGATTSWLLGSRLVRPVNHPVPLPPDLQAQAVAIPGSGHAIAAWWPDQGGGSPVVLLLHAIRADRSSMVGRAKLLSSRGFSVLLIDLQAHGETPGAAITVVARVAGDIRVAFEWLKLSVPGRRSVVIGSSLGVGAVVLVSLLQLFA